MTNLTTDLATLDATAQADLVRRREVSSLELVDAAIDRIERLNPRINAVVTPLYDAARKEAAGPLPDGPFTGVPFLLKDLAVNVAGVPSTGGSAMLRSYVPSEDSVIVRRYRSGGLVVIGKTNTPEFGLLPTTEPRLFGPCRNPWDLGRSTGGSSGGAAAAVASGMVPAAHASDGGGSIRIPASCCGLFGLKPTRGRTPRVPEPSGLSIDHAVSRSVRDSAALLDAVSGPHPGNPHCAPTPARPFLDEVGADAGRLRVGFTTRTLMGEPVHDDCMAAVKDAAALCDKLGHHVEEASPPIPGALFEQLFIELWCVGSAASDDGMALLAGRVATPDDVETLTWALAERGRALSAPRYVMTLALLQQISEGIAKFFESHDIWITPVLAEPPLAIGSFDAPPDDPMRGFDRAVGYVPHTPICNSTGQPAMSVPLYWNQQGLPIGTHFVARFGDEATLFRLASQLEQERPWAHRWPPVSALELAPSGGT